MSSRRLLVALCLLAVAAAGAAPWTDDFTAPRRYERWGPNAWRLGGGQAAFRSGGGEAFLVATGPQSREITVEADLTLSARAGGTWALAGLTLFADPMNHWRLVLVEGPRQDRYFEFVEMFNGAHQAQNGAESPRTRLDGKTTEGFKTWEYGQRYHLRLTLTPAQIVGAITDPATGAIWERTFSFATGEAVKSGRAGLTATDMNGAFRSLKVEAVIPPPNPALALQPGRLGTVAVVPDQEQVLAPRVAELLRGQGYGATIVPWDQLDQPLPWDQLDALVVADARRVPLALRDQLVEASHCAGKVLCLGAPALSTLLVKGPDGRWLPQNQWRQAYARTIQRRPIAIAPGAWQRQTDTGDAPGAVLPDPASGPTAWRVDATLKGWDTWKANVTQPFDERYRLLMFEAKGDATTTQLSVECDEADGSRWVAIVDLQTDWQTQVLRPGDFTYWQDSRSKGRGGAGDRMHPENVTAIIFGLARSHTAKVLPGAHSFWLREISAGDGQGLPEPDFTVPSLDALCPSYKLYPLTGVAQLRPAAAQFVTGVKPVTWNQPGFAPVWREQGRGLHRERPWRWLPVLDAYDAQGRKRGALVSLMLGNAVHPDAAWANVAVSDPAEALSPALAPVVLDTLAALSRGTFLLEGGAELFSLKPGERTQVGGQALALTREARPLTVHCVVRDGRGKVAFDRQQTLDAQPRVPVEAAWPWQATFAQPGGYEVETTLLAGTVPVDRITHRIEPTRVTPARPEEFVRVNGSNFTLAGKPWTFRGVNYWGNWVAGYPNLNIYQRSTYDPEIVERDLTQLQAMGVNALSAVQALIPPDATAPNAFRDQIDFLDRCDRHGIKVFFFLRDGRPYYGADFAKIKRYIEQAGIKNHPAIMCWELAWEPIDTPWEGRLDPFLGDWNRWIVQRYGSVAAACADWGFTPERTADGQIPVPDRTQCQEHGVWDRYVAAFRRAHTDLISAAYRDLARPLRAWDPQHLVSFRGGACGIPWASFFAHIHSPGAAKHMDFLNPEGYSLQINGIGTLTDPEYIRRGGLITLLYRFTSREKPVVWMEFGYTVNGIHTDWSSERVFIEPEQLQRQADELRNFYAMFLESGARGAAPWWWPGGFRLGENSDFGLCEPDGTERPACDVMREMLPRFAGVQHPQPTDFINLEFDAHYPDSWPLYSQQYLDLVKAGKQPYVRTAGTGTDSANCPLTAVGGVPYNGHNPPLFLNSEFNSLEVKVGSGAWQPVADGATIVAPAGAAVLCRASVGNLGEAKWLAPKEGQPQGTVFLVGREEYGLRFQAPIAADTAYLADAQVRQFTLVPAVAAGEQKVSFEMASQGRAIFGERRTLTVKAR